MNEQPIDTLERKLNDINQSVLKNVPIDTIDSEKKPEIPSSIWAETIDFNQFIAERERESPYKGICYEQLVDPYADAKNDTEESQTREVVSELTKEKEVIESKDANADYFEDYDD